MLVGYASDENFAALEGVALEFESGSDPVEARSRASGAVYADLSPGKYRVTLVKAGYGAKRVEMIVEEGRPHQFRLLSDGLLGYAWPKWARAGEKSEWRVHSPEAYKLELWRYGFEKEHFRSLGWYDEHGPRSVLQITPDGDYTQTGVSWNKTGYGLTYHKQAIVAPERSGLYYFHAKTESGRFFAFPWIVQDRKSVV